MKMIEQLIQDIIFQKDCNVKIDGRSFFDQSINDGTKTYENIEKLLLSE